MTKDIKMEEDGPLKENKLLVYAKGKTFLYSCCVKIHQLKVVFIWEFFNLNFVQQER